MATQTSTLPVGKNIRSATSSLLRGESRSLPRSREGDEGLRWQGGRAGTLLPACCTEQQQPCLCCKEHRPPRQPESQLVSACALGSAGKSSAGIAGGRNEDEKLLQAVALRWWLTPGCAPDAVALTAPERVEQETRAPCKPLGLGERSDSQLLLCVGSHRSSAAQQEMSARGGSAACTSCRGCQPRARSSSIPAEQLRRQQGKRPAWGWQLEPRRR